jgi:hypothetical protein
MDALVKMVMSSEIHKILGISWFADQILKNDSLPCSFSSVMCAHEIFSFILRCKSQRMWLQLCCVKLCVKPRQISRSVNAELWDQKCKISCLCTSHSWFICHENPATYISVHNLKINSVLFNWKYWTAPTLPTFWRTLLPPSWE